MTKEKPIIFSAPMVRAILEGRKTQTRRILKSQPGGHWKPHSYDDVHKMKDGKFVMRNDDPIVIGYGPSNFDGDEAYSCPYGRPGSRLWVRENWKPEISHNCHLYPCECEDLFINYPAGGEGRFLSYDQIAEDWSFPKNFKKGNTIPSIHMPRWASRITLEITGIRVERLQDISEDDCLAEGIGQVIREGMPSIQQCGEYDSIDIDLVSEYSKLWEKINGAGSWDKNPWIWVIEFRRVNQ